MNTHHPTKRMNGISQNSTLQQHLHVHYWRLEVVIAKSIQTYSAESRFWMASIRLPVDYSYNLFGGGGVRGTYFTLFILKHKINFADNDKTL